MAADKKDKVLNVPNLRFPEFKEEWHTSTIDDVTSEFQSGKFIKADLIHSNGSVPVYGGNGLRGFTDTYNHIGDYVLIGRQGALCGNIRFVTGETYITEHAIAVKGTENNDTKYLQYLFERMNLGQYSDQSAQPGLAVSKLIKLKITIPQEREQSKIARFLTTIDERILTQIRIIEDLRSLKVYIHNRVFSKGNTLFGQRNTIRLSDIATKITRKNKGNTINNVLSNSASMGIVPQTEVFDKEIANEDNTSNYYVIGGGDFVYNPRKSVQAPFGPINMYRGQAEGIISPLYLCFQVNDINKNYLLHYFMSNVWHSYIYSNGDTGVRHDRVSIKDETFLDMPLYIHTVDKQQEIAKMMDQVDEKIALEEMYLAQLQKQKGYLLAAMFV